jgi:hypothetical protein
MRKLVVLLLVALGLLLLSPAVASASTPTLRSLAKSLAALQKQIKTQKAQIKSLNTRLAEAKSVLALAPFVSLTGSTLNGVSGPNIVFQGANVTVRSSNYEDDGSGTGNLIVGWDDEPGGTLPSHFRDGDNNLVCGDWNNFIGTGGFVAGSDNTLNYNFDSVSGGEYNTAGYASFSDGLGVQGGPCASVSGGDANTASGGDASVSGGQGNTASGDEANVSGGQSLNESTMYGWMAGSYQSP